MTIRSGQENPPVHKDSLIRPNSTPEESASKNLRVFRRHRGGLHGDLNDAKEPTRDLGRVTTTAHRLTGTALDLRLLVTTMRRCSRNLACMTWRGQVPPCLIGYSAHV